MVVVAGRCGRNLDDHGRGADQRAPHRVHRHRRLFHRGPHLRGRRRRGLAPQGAGSRADRSRRDRRRQAGRRRPAHVAYRDRRPLALLRRAALRLAAHRQHLADRRDPGGDRGLAGVPSVADGRAGRGAVDGAGGRGVGGLRLDPALFRRFRHAGRVFRLRRRVGDPDPGVLGPAGGVGADRAWAAARRGDDLPYLAPAHHHRRSWPWARCCFGS